jgi:RNA recognition motif-containing protein
MNIYVGNLNYKVSENELKGVFEEYGTVSSVKIITDKFTGRSKGFGFVTIDDESDAARAIKELNGATLENREMVVNEARPRKESHDQY